MLQVKPQTPIINWGMPITQGLIFDLPLFEHIGNPRDLVSRNIGVFSGTPLPTWKITENGLGVDFVGTASAGDTLAVPKKSFQQDITKLTYECWVMRRGSGGNSAGTMLRESNGLNSSSLRHDGGNSETTFGYPWTVSGSWSFTQIPADGKLHHVVVTYDAGSTANDPRAWLDAVNRAILERVAPTGSVLTALNTEFVVGNINQTGNVGNRTWDGIISMTRVWRRILSDTEIKWLYENPMGIYRSMSNQALNSITVTPPVGPTYTVGPLTARGVSGILSIMAGLTETQPSQKVIADHLGIRPYTAHSVQEMLSIIQGIQPLTSKSVQELFWRNISTKLSLTGSYTQFSVQEMLNIAYNSSMTLAQVLGES